MRRVYIQEVAVRDGFRIEPRFVPTAEKVALVDALSRTGQSVSVAIKEVKPEDWEEKVYRADILANRQKLYKKPGYNDFT